MVRSKRIRGLRQVARLEQKRKAHRKFVANYERKIPLVGPMYYVGE
jgi:hypothetical protein